MKYVNRGRTVSHLCLGKLNSWPNNKGVSVLNMRCGWERMYIDHVQQAHLGADLDFLRGASGSATPRESH